VQSPLNVSRVEFLVDNVVVGTDASSPFTLDWNTTGSHQQRHRQHRGPRHRQRRQRRPFHRHVRLGQQRRPAAAPPPVSVTLTQLQAEIFSVCTGCHDGSAAPAGRCRAR
jgi:hypothetical protein